MTAPFPRTIADLVVPVAALVAQDRAGVLVAAAAVTRSPSDRAAYALDLTLLAHPELCSTDADYPGWTPGQTGGGAR